MGLRDRINGPAVPAIPAISAIVSPKPEAQPARIATIATIAPSELLPPSHPFHGIPTIAQEAEIRSYLDRILGDHPDKPIAIAIALRMPEAALESFRDDEAKGLL